MASPLKQLEDALLGEGLNLDDCRILAAVHELAAAIKVAIPEWTPEAAALEPDERIEGTDRPRDEIARLACRYVLRELNAYDAGGCPLCLG